MNIEPILESLRSDVLFELEQKYGDISSRLGNSRLMFRLSSEDTALMASADLSEFCDYNRVPVTIKQSENMIFLYSKDAEE